MMISPELYYDESLKGKSAEEIMHQIRSLKKDCNRLKRELESNCLEPTIAVSPSPLTMIKVYREYLERAKQALKEVGEQYKPTYFEKKDIAFNESLASLKSISLLTENNQSSESIEISILGETISCNRFSFNHFNERTLDISKSELIDILSEMHLGEWKRNYYNSDSFEGVRWCLDIIYSDGRRRVTFSGINEFPYNFNELAEFFDSVKPAISAFEYPASFEVYPKGSTIRKNKDGTITIIPPENV